ncbi:hypothetical protein [Paraferrimonas sedimenticola]|uniref:Uncharacterized protein n=1 Tax=Paraferrimonas sedimenticola TaxID=375674 RepID=A0AA37RZE2_9GAMM|nr:hypothetical protein [Paraferrimonas sedimenticola]GLP98134.1 hypothetical protein GCM10007895_34410 [Paraferrimonas sedimenticola]
MVKLNPLAEIGAISEFWRGYQASQQKSEFVIASIKVPLNALSSSYDEIMSTVSMLNDCICGVDVARSDAQQATLVVVADPVQNQHQWAQLKQRTQAAIDWI